MANPIATCTNYKAEAGQMIEVAQGHIYSLAGLAEHILELAAAGYYADPTEYNNISWFIKES